MLQPARLALLVLSKPKTLYEKLWGLGRDYILDRFGCNAVRYLLYNGIKLNLLWFEEVTDVACENDTEVDP